MAYKDSELMTDDFKSYKGLDKEFKSHDIIKHSENEYVKGIFTPIQSKGFLVC